MILIGLPRLARAAECRGCALWELQRPQQYFQLKQQADLRKQEFAQQQAQFEEQKKQHAFQQVTSKKLTRI